MPRRKAEPEFVDEDESELKPETLKRVRVLSNYRIVHDSVPYTHGDVVEIPESLATEYVLSKWVEESPKASRRGRRTGVWLSKRSPGAGATGDAGRSLPTDLRIVRSSKPLLRAVGVQDTEPTHAVSTNRWGEVIR
jgi:hypothetical protein